MRRLVIASLELKYEENKTVDTFIIFDSNSIKLIFGVGIDLDKEKGKRDIRPHY